MFYYRDVSGKDHVVWYLDALTVNQQLPTLESLGIKNISVWRMGSEDPKIWSIIERFARGTK